MSVELSRRGRFLVAAAITSALAASSVPATAAVTPLQGASGNTPAGGATSLTITLAGTPASGDVLVAAIGVAGQTAITAPAGWTLIADTASSATHQSLYVRVAGAAEPRSAKWTFAGSVTASGWDAESSGVDATFPVDQSAAATGASGTATAPSVTTLYSGDYLSAAALFDANTTVTADPRSGASLTANSSATTSFGEGLLLGSAGPSAALTATPALTTTPWVDQTVALKSSAAAGVLSVASSAAPSFSANLDSGDQTPTFSLPVTVSDTRAGALGWNLTITSTTYSTGGATPHLLSPGASSVTGASSVCELYGCVAPTNAISYPVAVPAGSSMPTAVKLFDAAAGTGRGQNTATGTVAVTVPQNSFAGSYTSTISIAVVSGP